MLVRIKREYADSFTGELRQLILADTVFPVVNPPDIADDIIRKSTLTYIQWRAGEVLGLFSFRLVRVDGYLLRVSGVTESHTAETLLSRLSELTDNTPFQYHPADNLAAVHCYTGI